MDPNTQNLSAKDLEQKNKFEQLYKQQEEERNAQKLLKQKLDEEINDPKEKMLVIQKEFKEKHDDLSNKIKVFMKESLKMEDLFSDFKSLKNYFISTNHALTTFDKQQYKDQLEKLEKYLFILRDKVQPRKKFKFSQRIKDQYKNQNSDSSKQVEKPKEDYFNQVPGFQNLENQTLKPNQAEVQPSFKLFNLKNCEVYLNFVFDNIYIKQLQNCKIYIGPVKSSIFIDGCQDCELNLMGHQLRIHNSVSNRFNIFSSSKSIIEHCTKLEFSQYRYSYEGLEEQIKEAGFQQRENLWRDIQDFNWLKQEKSPNFTLIE